MVTIRHFQIGQPDGEDHYTQLLYHIQQLVANTPINTTRPEPKHMPTNPPPLPPTPTLHHRRRRHHCPPHRQIHPRRLLDPQPHRRPLRPRTAPSPTLREARLARRRPQRPLHPHPLAAHLLPQRPLRPFCRASLGDRGLGIEGIRQVRAWLDAAGRAKQMLLCVGDGRGDTKQFGTLELPN
jgi:hypothetical protein